MEIKLIDYTPNPSKAIAAAFLNMGIGKDTTNLDDLTDEETEDALKEIFKSHLDAPLEFASFNFFWMDIPIFLRAQLVRHRVGWGFAERSLRFFDANLRKQAVEHYDWVAMPTVDDKVTKNPIFGGKTRREIVESEMNRQLDLYSLLLEEGVDQQDARNIIGVFYPTAMQTTCSFRALRGMLADRLSSQAHPLWQKAAHQIKDQITAINKQLGDALVDSCEMYGKCVWRSKYDRDCEGCIKRGWEKPHDHQWLKDTTLGKNTQCPCGELRKELLKSGN